jgi:hypothetical protein
MTSNTSYPFSDLTPEQVRMLIRAARNERSNAIREFLAGMFVRPHRSKPWWPPRQREAQVWPPKNAPALSRAAYC